MLSTTDLLRFLETLVQNSVTQAIHIYLYYFYYKYSMRQNGTRDVLQIQKCVGFSLNQTVIMGVCCSFILLYTIRQSMTTKSFQKGLILVLFHYSLTLVCFKRTVLQSLFFHTSQLKRASSLCMNINASLSFNWKSENRSGRQQSTFQYFRLYAQVLFKRYNVTVFWQVLMMLSHASK